MDGNNHSITDKASFATGVICGRVKELLAAYAEGTGIAYTQLANGLAAFLQSETGGEVHRPEHHLPALRRPTSRTRNTTPSEMALAERPHRHQTQMKDYTPSGKRSGWTPEEVALLQSYHAQGISYENMGKKLGRSESSIKAALVRYVTHRNRQHAKVVACRTCGEEFHGKNARAQMMQHKYSNHNFTKLIADARAAA